MVYEVVSIVLLVIICFLLYKLYTIKYVEGKMGDKFVPGNLKKDLMELDDDKGRTLEMRFNDINFRISEIERKTEKSESFAEKLAEELS